MQQADSQVLSQFGDTLNAAVDEQLLYLVRLEAQNKSSSNITYLLNTCAQAIIRIMNATPNKLEACWMLFLNR